MEVHHHPDLHHRKKHFREYLLEFLMIFLAVTMGFFAETIRERISEKHREKDYMIGLINNAQDDTTELQGLIGRNNSLLDGIDSLMSVSAGKFPDPRIQDSIYYYALKYTFALHIFQFNDLTLVQLRNAGGYNLIKTDGVADSIALYESKNNDIKILERFYVDDATQTWTAFRQVFNCTLGKRFFSADSATNKIPSDFQVLISSDREKFSILLNDYWTFAGTVWEYNARLKAHREYLVKFITFLKDKYDLN